MCVCVCVRVREKESSEVGECKLEYGAIQLSHTTCKLMHLLTFYKLSDIFKIFVKLEKVSVLKELKQHTYRNIKFALQVVTAFMNIPSDS